MTNFFGTHLGLLLDQKGWSPATLSEAIGVDASYVRRLTTGARIPIRRGPELVERIGLALDLDDRKKEALLASFRKSVAQHEADPIPHSGDLGAFVERIIGLDHNSGRSSTQSTIIRRKEFSGEVVIANGLSALANLFKNHSSSPVYVFFPTPILANPEINSVFQVAAEQSKNVIHLVSNFTQTEFSMSIIENIFRISSIIDDAPNNYQPIEIEGKYNLSFMSCADSFIVFFPVKDTSDNFLAFSFSDRRICRIACTLMRDLVSEGRELIKFLDDRSMDFQQNLFEIEDRSSIRKGIFDEGLSFLTHPPMWYSDNSDFEIKVAWRNMPSIQKRKYKNLLRTRLLHARDFLNVQEIVSGSSLLKYIQSGLTSEEFYEKPYSLQERKEHISHLIEMITDRDARYSLFIGLDDELFLRNRSWAAYNDAVFFGKVYGGRHIDVIIESVPVAFGFGEVFEAAKRRCTKRFPDPRSTADWLRARLSEVGQNG